MNNNIIELSAPESVNMADEWFQIASMDHFWRSWRFIYIKKNESIFLNQYNKILEIGCGNGIILRQFEKYSNKIIDGCDLNLYALSKIDNFNGKKYIYNIYDLNPNMVGNYDCIILLDVIEHIDADIEFLKVAVKHLKNGGYVVINVPALNWLFSQYDIKAGHKRRYTKKTLKKLFQKSGVEIVKMQYWGLSLIPLALMRKIILMVSKKNIIKTGFQPPKKWINSFLRILMKIETRLFEYPPIGTSLLAIGKVWK